MTANSCNELSTHNGSGIILDALHTLLHSTTQQLHVPLICIISNLKRRTSVLRLGGAGKSFRFCQAPPHLDIESASNQLVNWWETLIHLGSSLHDSLGIKNRPIKTQSNDDGCHCKNIPKLNGQIWFKGSWAWFVVSVYLGLYPGASDLSSWHSTSASHSSTSNSTYQERGTSFHSPQCRIQ